MFCRVSQDVRSFCHFRVPALSGLGFVDYRQEKLVFTEMLVSYRMDNDDHWFNGSLWIEHVLLDGRGSLIRTSCPLECPC